VDVVLLGLGIDPAVAYLDGTDLVADGAVPVNERLETAAEGVFAAGDIALVPDGRGGRRRIEHWTVAERQGRHAARAMLGDETPYTEVPFFWTRQFGTSVHHMGHVRDAARIAYRGDVEDGDFAAAYFDADGAFRAAAACGRSTLSIALERLLAAGAPLEPEELEDESVEAEALLERAVSHEADGA
jgi:3-phenylpropionate/trans-cinnamate dioxygenase ferredoxin reductase subunit